MLKVDAIQREVAAKVKDVTFVDAHTLFADDDGEYQRLRRRDRERS